MATGARPPSIQEVRPPSVTQARLPSVTAWGLDADEEIDDTTPSSLLRDYFPLQTAFDDASQQAVDVFADAVRAAHLSLVAKVRLQLAQAFQETQHVNEKPIPNSMDKSMVNGPESALGRFNTAPSSLTLITSETMFGTEQVASSLQGNLPGLTSVVPGSVDVSDQCRVLSAWESQPWTPAPKQASFSIAAQSVASASPRRFADVVSSATRQGNSPFLSCATIMESQNKRRTSMARVTDHIKRQKTSMDTPDKSVPRAEKSRGNLFPDKSEMMSKVQAGLCKPEYKVTNFYHEEGNAQMIARSSAFEHITLFVIGINSMYIGVDIDYNTDPYNAPLFFQVMEHLFCTYFFVEWLIRFLAFAKKRDCLRDSWFVFDSVLVWMGVFETWVMAVVVATVDGQEAGLGGQTSVLRLLRMLRLARTARMARLMRAVPEIMIMFKGMVVASHAVFCTVGLLAVVIYVFALTFRQITQGMPVGDRLFPSVPHSMGVLLLSGTLPDFADFVYTLNMEHILLATLGFMFVLLSTLVVLNMLAGVLVNVVLVVAELEKEQTDALFVRKSLALILQIGDTDGDMMISKDEFDDLLMNEEAGRVLEQVNVDILGLVELSDFIFYDDNAQIPFEDFFKLILKLRGSNAATVKDIVEMRKFVVTELNLLEKYLTAIVEHCTAGTPIAQPGVNAGVNRVLGT